VANHTVSAPVAAAERLAHTRLGLFTAPEAYAVGVTPELLNHHSRPGGRWRRVLPRVYELAGQPPDRRRPPLAALLWAGPRAVLSHHTAARILRLDGALPGRRELWAPRGHAPEGITLHRGVVPPEDVARTGMLLHTTLDRTVRDLAHILDDETLELVVESVLRRRPGWRADLDGGSRQGAARLQRVLARRPPGAPATESELETRYLQAVRTVGLPAPTRQHRVVDDRGICLGRLDLCWPDAGLWVELDGRAYHEQPKALLHDRRRQNELAIRLQWQPLRFTWEDVVHHPNATARTTWLAYQRRFAG
jgi:very-short-patch-repair endonuclease